MTFILKKLLAAFSTRQRSASQGLHGIFALLVSAVLMAVASTASAAPDVITYIHTDVSGSPLAATDDTGAVVWKESYRAYGERWLHQSGSEQQTQWFHGKEQDAATGLQYFGVRHYDPVVGRFMGIDPVDVQEGNLHSFNRYAYGNNNPVKFKDPDGGYAEAAFEALSLAIGIDSFRQNFGAGNYAAAAVDGMGVAADAVLAAIPVAPGIAGLGIKAVRESSELAAKGTTSLFRAVGPGELADIGATGALRNLGSAEGKYFTTSAAEASAYAKQAVKAFGDQPYTIIRTDVPNSIFKGLSPATVDRGIPAWVIPTGRLPGLVPSVMNHSPLPPVGF